MICTRCGVKVEENMSYFGFQDHPEYTNDIEKLLAETAKGKCH